MASDLERIADAVRHLAAADGGVRSYLERAVSDVRSLAGSVPSGVPSATFVVASLQSASVSLQRASSVLERFSGDAARFADSLAGGGGGGGGAAAAPGDAGGGPSAAAFPPGFELISLADVEDSDPDLAFEKVPEADLVWAVEALRDVVLPGMQRGLTLDDFRDMDAQLGQQGTRSYADTYSGFFGDSALRVDRGADGRLGVTNGRHRILVARRLGLTWLPGRRS